MAQLVVLHVGLMKSGTTFLQGRMGANRERLAEQGVLFPGPGWGRQVRAVADLLGGRERKKGAWKDLVRELHAYPGTAVVSMEYLGPANPLAIKKAANAFRGTEVRVVVTVRDLGRTVPAMWQETIKNRATTTWPEFLHAIEHGGRTGRRFWRQQDASRVVRRWADGFGAAQTHVLTVPPPGAPPEVLWERFSAIAGIAPGRWSEAPRANESLGAASTVVMRELNLATKDFSVEQYKKRVKALAKHVLSEHRREEDAIGYTVQPWLRDRAAQIRRDLTELGVPVTGDLAELEPLDVRGVDPTTVGPEAQLQAAVAGLAGALHHTPKITRG